MLSFPEILVILIVAVLVLGPKRLPETARKLGHWIGVFKRASEEFKRELMTMDRVVDDTLNRATQDFEHLVPEETLPPTLSADADLIDLIGAPPPESPDDVLETAPIPGGLAPESPKSPVALGGSALAGDAETLPESDAVAKTVSKEADRQGALSSDQGATASTVKPVYVTLETAATASQSETPSAPMSTEEPRV